MLRASLVLLVMYLLPSPRICNVYLYFPASSLSSTVSIIIKVVSASKVYVFLREPQILVNIYPEALLTFFQDIMFLLYVNLKSSLDFKGVANFPTVIWFVTFEEYSVTFSKSYATLSTVMLKVTAGWSSLSTT